MPAPRTNDTRPRAIDMPAEPDPEWDEFTAHYRSCLSCRRLGRDTDLPLVCATADQILDAILTPLSVAIEASDDYAALCRAMEALDG